MKPCVRKLHRYVGLTMLALWLIQAATGVLMVFHWELGDSLVPGPARAVDVAAISRRVATLSVVRPGSRVTSVFATGGAADRYEIFIEDPRGRTDVLKIDGAGTVLDERPSDYNYLKAGVIETAVVLHQSLFAGDTGRRLLGVSALVLLASVVVGVTLAWPARATWRRALAPWTVRSPAARRYAWHRAIGLWLAAPALLFIGAGMLLAFDDPLEALLSAAPQPPVAVAAFTGTPDPQLAIETALARFPGATLTSVKMPSATQPWYRVRVLQPGELRRVFGTTTINVGAQGGVLSIEDPRTASWQRRFLDATYPIHTGEFAGLPGRLLALATGSLLLAAMVFGTLLWSQRRTTARQKSPDP